MHADLKKAWLSAVPVLRECFELRWARHSSALVDLRPKKNVGIRVRLNQGGGTKL